MKLADDLTKRIYGQQGMPKKVDKKMVMAFADQLWEAVVKGYGNDLVDIDYDKPDADMLRSLQHNVYQFSSAKNWHQMKSLTEALIGEDKKLRSWSEFKKAAFKLNEEHVVHWLKAEYDTAVAAGQMASKWVQIQKTKDRLPYLEFDAVIDGRTSDLCRSFNGVLLRADDPFWDMYYPPNHFRCRSMVRQRASGVPTDVSKIAIPEKLPEMFKVNLGKRGLAFPPNHPYFNHVPDNLLLQFGDANFSNIGSNVYLSGLARDPLKNNDLRYQAEYKLRLEIAPLLSKHFNKGVYINPDFSTNADWRYKYFFDKVPVAGKMPDYKIDGRYWELKSYEKKFKIGKITRMLTKGIDQSDLIILKLNHKNLNMKQITKKVQEGMKSIKNKDGLQIQEVLIIDANGKIYAIKKPTISGG